MGYGWLLLAVTVAVAASSKDPVFSAASEPLKNSDVSELKQSTTRMQNHDNDGISTREGRKFGLNLSHC